MTPQEQQLLQDLTSRVNQTVLQEKDPEAERYLQDTLGRNPDALYILAQTTLVQQYALDQAKKQLEDARRQAAEHPAAEKHTSFLGSLLGMGRDEPAHAAPPPPPPSQAQYQPVNVTPPQYGQPQYGQPQYGQPQYDQPQYGQPQYGQPQYGQPQSGGFLRSAMQTATGVAAGALAFEGIESLMHGFGQHAGYGQGFGDLSGGGPREEVVNNYYGDSAAHDRGMSPDIEDRRDLSGQGSDDTLADNDPDDFASSGSDYDTSNDTSSESLADNDPSDFGSSDDSNG